MIMMNTQYIIRVAIITYIPTQTSNIIFVFVYTYILWNNNTRIIKILYIFSISDLTICSENIYIYIYIYYIMQNAENIISSLISNEINECKELLKNK